MQKPTPRLLSLAILSAALGLTACNSNDDTGQLAPGKKTVTVTPSLGRISNAHVRLRNAANLQEVGTQALVNGQAVFSVPSSVSAVIAEVVPDANATYFDEATRQDEPFPAGTPLRAAFTLPNGNSMVGVTALTEAAVQRAQTLAGGATQPLTPAQIGEANQLVNQAFGIDNILTPPALVGSVQDFSNLVNDTAASRYALRLAALAQQASATLGAGASSPAAAMAKALASDLADGKLDQQAGGAAIPNLPYGAPASFQADLIAALNSVITTVTTAAQSGLTQDQIAKLTQLATTLAGSITIQPTPYVPPTCASMGLTAAAGTAAVADFVGDYTVTINKASGQSTGTLTVSANGNLTLGGATATARAICVAPAQANGTPLLILTSTAEAGSTHLAMANLFKDAAGVLSVEGMVFSGSEAGSYYGVKGGGSGGNTDVTVSSVSPTSAAPGDQITLTGSGFGADKTKIEVVFEGGKPGTIVSASDTQLVVQVPTGAQTGPISVTNTATGKHNNSPTLTVSAGGGGGGQVTFGDTVYTLAQNPTGVLYPPNQIVWDGAKFVGLEQSRDYHNANAKFTAWTSTDGMSWTRTLTDMTSGYPALTTMNNLNFQVQLGWQSNFSGVKISTSTDAVHWTANTVTSDGFGTSTLLGGKYLKGRYFLSLDTDCTLITSTDAASWSVVDLKTVAMPSGVTGPSGTGDYCSQPVYRTGKYYVYRGVVAVGGTFNNPDHYEGIYYSSADGLAWTAATFALPAGFNKIPMGGRSFTVYDTGTTIVIPTVRKVSYFRNAQGFKQEVVDDQKVATSTDGVNWSFADAAGVTYQNGTIGHPGPAWTFFTGPQGMVVADNLQNIPPYYTTTDGVNYTPGASLGLINTSPLTRIWAWSDTLKRLVVFSSDPLASGFQIGVKDY